MSLQDQLTTLALVLITVQVINHFQLASPDNVWYARGAYIASQVFILTGCLYVKYLIKRKNETSTTVVVTDPAKPFSSETPAERIMTVRDYDLAEIAKVIQSTFVGMAVLGFLHWKFEIIQPLLIQSVLPFKTLLSSFLFQIHVFGLPPVGKLSRPFKTVSPFGELLEKANGSPAANGDDTGSAIKDKDKKGKKKVVMGKDGVLLAASGTSSPRITEIIDDVPESGHREL